MLTVLVVLVILLTGVLNYFFRSQRVNRADQYYEAANQFLAKDRVEEAIEQFRRAVSVSHSVRHRLALGLALVKAGRLEEASVYLNEVLSEDPVERPRQSRDGADPRAAGPHRRGGGTIPPGVASGENPLQSRTELIDMLAKAGRRGRRKRELRAASTRLPDDHAARRQIGHMLLHYGLPDDAATVFRDLLRRDRRDAAAYDGLGEAEVRPR